MKPLKHFDLGVASRVRKRYWISLRRSTKFLSQFTLWILLFLASWNCRKVVWVINEIQSFNSWLRNEKPSEKRFEFLSGLRIFDTFVNIFDEFETRLKCWKIFWIRSNLLRFYQNNFVHWDDYRQTRDKLMPRNFIRNLCSEGFEIPWTQFKYLENNDPHRFKSSLNYVDNFFFDIYLFQSFSANIIDERKLI